MTRTFNQRKFFFFLAALLAACVPFFASAATTKVFLTSGSTWQVPAEWVTTGSSVEVIGGGGSGLFTSAGGSGGGAVILAQGLGNSTGGCTGNCGNGTGGGGGGSQQVRVYGGGGGAYSKITDVALTPGGSIAYHVGIGGKYNAAAGANGGSSWLCNSASNCATMSASAVIVSAAGALKNVGGLAASGKGSVKRSGGNGGTSIYPTVSGGGGAGGTLQNGGAGSGNKAGVGGGGPAGAGGLNGAVGKSYGGGGSSIFYRRVVGDAIDSNFNNNTVAAVGALTLDPAALIAGVGDPVFGGGINANTLVGGGSPGGSGGAFNTAGNGWGCSQCNNSGGAGGNSQQAGGGGSLPPVVGAGGAGGTGIIIISYPSSPFGAATDCSVRVSPSTIASGGSATLSWSSDNADTFTISNVGNVTPNTNGSTIVRPSQTTTYTGRVARAGLPTVECSSGPAVLTVGVPTITSETPSPILCPPSSYTCSGNKIMFDDGSCNVSTVTTCVAPSMCVPGSSVCVTTINGSLQVVPPRVHPKDTVTVSWNYPNAVACTVRGTNGDVWVGTSSQPGGQQSSPILYTTTYTATCDGNDLDTAEDDFSESKMVTVLPTYIEL